jgi:hypothetical protein
MGSVIFGHSVNATAGGSYLFLLICIALIIGVVKRRKVNQM